MPKEFNGGIGIATGFNLQDPQPIDDRLVVGLLADLISNAALPNPYPGMVVSVASEGYDLYRWNGTDRTQSSNWILVGSSESGTSGINGTSGTDGTDGDTGANGLPGENGTSGINGTSGTDGADGANGLPGNNGTDGENGTSGINGTSGTDGADGANGLPGNNGADGTSGTDGNDGAAGNDGADGTSGTDGAAGNDGADGTSGTDGNDGADGTSGTDGNDGADGTSGTSGTSGPGVPSGGATGETLVKIDGTDYNTQWATAASGSGVNSYLLRLDYDTSNHLVNNLTQNTFIGATGYETTGASVSSVSVNTGTAVYTATISFANESNPPQNILIYAWNPVTYTYQVHPYRVDAADLKIDTVAGDFTSSSNQYTPDIFGSFDGVTTTIDVRQDFIKYGNATGLGAGRRFAHAYVVFTF